MDICVEIGIVILNYNSYETVVKCVSSILKYEKKIRYTIYIVDNASTDGSLHKLHNHYSSLSFIKIVDAKINGGYSYGNNCGINEAKKDGVKYIVIANPDTCLENNAISKLIEFMKRNETVSIAGPELRQPDAQKQFARKKVTFWRAIFCKSPFRYISIIPDKLKRTTDWEGKGDFIFDGMVAGCFFAVCINDFNETGLFDEDFFLYYEEDVIAYNLSAIEKKAAIVPAAKVFHDHSTTTKKEGMTFIYFYYRISEFLLLCKYGHINRAEKTFIYMIDIIWSFLYLAVKNRLLPRHLEFRKILKEIYTGDFKKANPMLYGK